MPRLGTELRAPFAEGEFAGLVLEEQEDWPDFPDAAWDRYRQDGDLAALAEAYLGFVQATFLPSLLYSLEPFSSASERESIADTLEAAIRSAITTDAALRSDPVAHDYREARIARGCRLVGAS